MIKHAFDLRTRIDDMRLRLVRSENQQVTRLAAAAVEMASASLRRAAREYRAGRIGDAAFVELIESATAALKGVEDAITGEI